VSRKLDAEHPAAVWSPEEIRALVKSLSDLVEVLGAAEPHKKADLYESLGLSLTYEPAERKVLVEADLSGVRMLRVGGPTRTLRTPLVVGGELALVGG
jgi:hypothetical protein